MKALTYIIITTILALGIAAPAASAQKGPPGGKGKQQQGQHGERGDMTAPWLRGITLTPEQQKKVDAGLADFRKQMQDAQKLAPEERWAKVREIMQSRQNKIREILNDEQKKIFDQNVKEMQSRFEGKGKGGPGKGKGEGKGPRGGKGAKAAPPSEE